MKIYILTDLEGPSGVVSFENQSYPTGKYNEKAKKLLTGEVNAAIEGACEAGVEEITVLDGHGSGGIEFEELDSRAKLIMGGPLALPLEIDNTFDGLFFVGQHAMAGAEKAVLSHTYSSSIISNYWLNGKLIGELGINAAVAGYFDVPTLLVTGDRAVAEEARAIIPEIETAVVKEGISRGAAICLSLERSRELIKEKARAAVKRKDEIKPYKVEPPYELKKEYFKAEFAFNAYQKKGVEKLDSRTVIIKGDGLFEVLNR